MERESSGVEKAEVGVRMALAGNKLRLGRRRRVECGIGAVYAVYKLAYQVGGVPMSYVEGNSVFKDGKGCTGAALPEGADGTCWHKRRWIEAGPSSRRGKVGLREEEAATAEQWGVGEDRTEEAVRRLTGKRPLRGRWVECQTWVDIRSTCVAKGGEVAFHHGGRVLAVAHPLQALM